MFENFDNIWPWPEWEIEEEISSGSYGVVYQAVRRDSHLETRAAIKVITIPHDQSEIDLLQTEGMSPEVTKTYIQKIVEDCVDEIRLMESLRGIQNIVSVEDYRVVENAEGIGWHIYIRMELLTPFETRIRDLRFPEEEVIKLGCDICSALEICAKRDIIHRDIKPSNILVNDFGDYKLGDFGISRTFEGISGNFSKKGTGNYMAPEVAMCKKYDARVDIYSLGIVLYRLLNNQRIPFLDPEKQLLLPSERENALNRRLQGEPLKPPLYASKELAAVILKACEFDPDKRFSSPTEMKKALLALKNPEKKKPKVFPVLLGCLSATLVCGGVLWVVSGLLSGKNAEIPTEENNTIETTPTDASLSETSTEPVPVEIFLGSLPDKTTYTVDEELDITGMWVIASYADGSSQVIPTGFSCEYHVFDTGHPTTSSGTKEKITVDVEYQGNYTFFDVTLLPCRFIEKSVEVGMRYDEGDSTVGKNQSGNPVGWWLMVTARYLSTDETLENTLEVVHNIPITGTGKDSLDSLSDAGIWNDACNGIGKAWQYSSREDSGIGWGLAGFALPDDPTLAGTYQVNLLFGFTEKSVTFTLVYEGDYKTGTGWGVTNVVWD